jgi:hypothetical protein
VAQLATLPDRLDGKRVEPEPVLRRLVVPTSSRGSAVPQADLRHGRSTSRATHPTRLHGNNAQPHLDLLVDQRLGSSDLEVTAVTVSTVGAETAALRLGNKGTTEARTAMAAATGEEMEDTVDTEVQQEAMDMEHRLHLPAVLLLGCSRKHKQVTALPAWTTTVCHRRLLPQLLEFLLLRHLATCLPLPHRLHSRRGQPRTRGRRLRRLLGVNQRPTTHKMPELCKGRAKKTGDVVIERNYPQI